MSKLIVEINEDGTIKLNASKMAGSEKQLLAQLGELAKELGSELVVEKHIDGNHVHHHGDGKYHSHN
jgi:hypothetical protein